MPKLVKVGDKVGSLSIKGFLSSGDDIYVETKCACGQEKILKLKDIGRQKSCGHTAREYYYRVTKKKKPSTKDPEVEDSEYIAKPSRFSPKPCPMCGGKMSADRSRGCTRCLTLPSDIDVYEVGF